jgi:hypothetical protein
MTTTQITSLLRQRESLLKDLSTLNERLVRATLDQVAASSDALTAQLSKGAAGKMARANGKSRRSWFERGEMVKLAKKLLTQPMSQADLVRALASAKGYDKGLSSSDKARFKSAAYQAIAAALNGKQLFRNKLGLVSSRR